MNANKQRGSTAIGVILGVLIGLGVALYLSKSITDATERVKQGIKNIHQGRFSNRVSLNRKDEMGEMADTLDKFASDFQKYILGFPVYL